MTDFHGDDEETVVDGDLGRLGRHTPKLDPRMLLTLDVDDHIDPTSREWLTLDEAGRIVRTPEHEARAADLSVRFEAWRGGQQHLNAEQIRWTNLLCKRVQADAQKMNYFGGWNFDEHPFLALGGYNQAVHVFGGEETMGRLIAEVNSALFGRQQATDRINSAHIR